MIRMMSLRRKITVASTAPDWMIAVNAVMSGVVDLVAEQLLQDGQVTGAGDRAGTR